MLNKSQATGARLASCSVEHSVALSRAVPSNLFCFSQAFCVCSCVLVYYISFTMAHISLASTCPAYDPECESIEEFIERFAMLLEGDDKKIKSDKIIGALLVRALPVQVVTDLQRRLSPRKLTETS